MFYVFFSLYLSFNLLFASCIYVAYDLLHGCRTEPPTYNLQTEKQTPNAKKWTGIFTREITPLFLIHIYEHLPNYVMLSQHLV